MKARHYLFTTDWSIAAPLHLTAATLNDYHAWRKWWKGLESSEFIVHKPGVVGSKIKCVWRSATGYRLTLVITITNYVEDELFEFTSEGDLVGKGSCRFVPYANTTRISFVWDVSTTKTWMNLLGGVLKPIFSANHDWLMRRGETGLNDYLSQEPADLSN